LSDNICQKCTLPFLRQFWLGERQELLKELINFYKYQSARSCAEIFADLFNKVYGDFLKNKIVVPLPTIGEHIRRRGFDHTDKLVRALCWRCGGEYGRILRRRNNAVQVGADVEMRKKQAEGAYEAVLRADKDAEYVLVDDV